MSCPAKRSWQSTKPEFEDAPSDLRLRLACPICLSCKCHGCVTTPKPIQTVQARFGYCHRALAAHPSCLTGHKLRTSCWMHNWSFPSSCGGLGRNTNTGHSLLDFRLRAVCGNRHAQRNQRQRVCNPMSCGRMELLHRRVTAAATTYYWPEERGVAASGSKLEFGTYFPAV